MARLSSYKAEYAEQARKLCELGATDAEIADFFEVSTVTINKWKHDFPEFINALKTGKSAVDERVERSLYMRAIGYRQEAVKIFMPKDADKPVYAPYIEHIPPDTTACIFWLKNRRSSAWRDVRQHEIGGPGDFEQFTDAELIAAAEREAAELGVPVSDTIN